MKKLIILATALLALNATASEVQFKGGYDFYRKFKLFEYYVRKINILEE